MTATDDLVVSPTLMESAAGQLGNDMAEAAAIAELMSAFGSGLGDPVAGLGVRDALVALGMAIGDGADLVARELADLGTRVISTAQVAVLVDTDSAGYFTAADPI